MGAPLPRRPPLVPGLAPTPLPRPARGPRSAARLLAVGARRGGGRGEGGRGAPARPRPVDPGPPTLTSGPSAPGGTDTAAAEREPGGRWGDEGRGARPQQRRRPSAQAPVWIFDFPALGAPGANQLGARAHTLSRGRRSSPLPRPRPLSDQAGAPHPESPPNGPPSSTPNCLLSATTTPLNSTLNFCISKAPSIIPPTTFPNYCPLIPSNTPNPPSVGSQTAAGNYPSYPQTRSPKPSAISPETINLQRTLPSHSPIYPSMHRKHPHGPQIALHVPS